VNNALLSRCQVFVLKAFDEETLKKMALNAIEKDEILKSKEIKVESLDALIHRSGGDGRKLLNLLELVVNFSELPVVINDSLVEEFVATQTDAYDKTGDLHYDIISAFIKSIRGSDPNAALYYLARMIDGGEDPKFIARRLLILASEDISLANPNALLLANTTFDAVVKIGYPECQIILSQLVVYLATSPKSNSTYLALKKAQACHRNHPNLSIPLHLRNAPTGLMKKLDYGKDYKYAHNYEGNFVDQEFLPDAIKDEIFYLPSKNPKEQEIARDLVKKWKKYQ
jgi:putative ATPase